MTLLVMPIKGRMLSTPATAADTAASMRRNEEEGDGGTCRELHCPPHSASTDILSYGFKPDVPRSRLHTACVARYPAYPGAQRRYTSSSTCVRQARTVITRVHPSQTSSIKIT